MTARLEVDVTPKTTEQNRIVCASKSEAEVTNTLKTALEYYWRNEANCWLTRSIARSLCDSRASCLMFCNAMPRIILSAACAVARYPSVRPLLSCILAKRINVSSKFSTMWETQHSSFSTPILIAILRWGPPNKDVDCRWAGKNRDSWLISGFGVDYCWTDACCQHIDGGV